MRPKYFKPVLILPLILLIFVSSGCTFRDMIQEIEKPAGSMAVSELLETPVYNIEAKVFGQVSLLGELFCTCFELTSGGEKVTVWYDSMVEEHEEKDMVCCKIYGLGAGMEEVNVTYVLAVPEACTVPEGFVGGGREVVEDSYCPAVPEYQWPPVSVEGIKNGDWVVVTGELRSGTGTEPSTTFWATKIEKLGAVAGEETCGGMSLNEAKQIALASKCVENGTLRDTYMCNEGTGTWWLDLNIEKEGCNPACVVNVATKAAEINWRCTGAIPG